MRTLFAMIGCPYCAIASLGVIQANCSLPLDKQINIVEVLPQEINRRAIGDPRLSVLAALHKSESVQEWGFPVLMLDKEGLKRRFDDINTGNTKRALIRSVYSANHYETFLKEYLLW